MVKVVKRYGFVFLLGLGTLAMGSCGSHIHHKKPHKIVPKGKRLPCPIKDC